MKRTPLSRFAWVAAAAVLLPAMVLASPTHKTPVMPASMAQKSHAAHRIDLNSATREELMTLPGMDGAAADKVIEGRPWKNPQALVEKNVLSKADFAKAKSRITAKHLASPAKPR